MHKNNNRNENIDPIVPGAIGNLPTLNKVTINDEIVFICICLL